MRTTIGTIALACMLVVLAAGCATPGMRSQDLNHYSTLDPASVSPSARILRHGPYELRLMTPIRAWSTGNTVFYAQKRGTWTEYPYGEREELQKLCEEIESGVRDKLGLAGPSDIEDWLLYFQGFGLFHANTDQFKMDPTSPNSLFRGFGFKLRWAFYSGDNLMNNMGVPMFVWSSGVDFAGMHDYTLRSHRDLFPAKGRGKRLDITPTYFGTMFASDDPEMPCEHAVWAVCAYRSPPTGEPFPRVRFLTFPAKAGGPVHVDAATGQATLETERGTVPLYGPSGPDYLGKRFAAAVIQLLEGMSDEELEALEDAEW